MRHPAGTLSEIAQRALHLSRPDAVVTAGPLLISRAETGEPDYQLSEPLFILMAKGGKRLHLGDRTVEYHAGQCLLVTAALPLSGRFLDASPQSRRWR